MPTNTINLDLTAVDLQYVTDNGNSTTNNIELGANAGIILDNSSRLQEGTIDAGTGGNKGIAQICGLGYELKWEAGSLYVMNGNGNAIREVRYTFNVTPTNLDDISKGFQVGSLWVLDNGDVYECTDNTDDNAVWSLKVNAVPSLQDVTNVGSTSTNVISVYNAGVSSADINQNSVAVNDIVLNKHAYLTAEGLDFDNSATTSYLKATNVTTGNVVTLEFPDKASGSYTIATTADITSGGILHATATGTDTYAATITGVTSYADGDSYLIRFTNGNTAGATLNINAIGAVTLYRNNDGVLIGGDITSGGEMLCVYNSTLGGFQCIGTAPNTLFAYVTNADSVTINRGQPVYAFGATGNRMSVKLAYNTTDATSAQTYGLVFSTSIPANQKGLIIIQGVLDGLNFGGTWNDGDPVYLGATAGTLTKTKPFAPNHLVYLGVVERANAGNGIMYVRVQNGYELDELHNVQAQNPTLKDTLYYDNTVSPAQWKTASIGTILGYTPQAQLNGTGFVKATGTTISYDNSTYLTSSAIGVTIQGYSANTTTLGNTTTGSGSIVLGTSPTFTTSIITPTITGVSGALTFTNAAQSSGAVKDYTFTSAAHTAQTASTEVNAVNFNLSATLQHATGAITTQRDFYIQARTHSFVGASTITSSGTLVVSAAPIAGTNATLTDKYSIWSQSGNVYFQDANATNFRFGDAGGGNIGVSVIWLDQASSQTSSNWSVGQDGTNSYFNATLTGTVALTIGSVNQISITNTNITIKDGQNLVIGTTTGLKIGTATTQKIGFWNTTPDVRPTTAITAAAFVANSSFIANDTATFGGYTIGQVVAALKRIGLLA